MEFVVHHDTAIISCIAQQQFLKLDYAFAFQGRTNRENQNPHIDKPSHQGGMQISEGQATLLEGVEGQQFHMPLLERLGAHLLWILQVI